MKTEILRISRRVGLIDLFKEKGFKVGVEVGTDRGGYARDICSRFPELKLYTMDPWLPYNEGNEVKTQEDMDRYYQEAKEILAPYNCEVMKTTSLEAAHGFADNSIDCVFIDGDHEFPAVYYDIFTWAKKVRHGGIVCGHDYVKDGSRRYGVIEAVDTYVEKKSIEPLYILRKGTFVDCWMFYKP